MALTSLDAGPNAVPEVCTTIEEVGSTGVGALTITFIILVICGIVFLYKAVNSAAQKKCVHCLRARTARARQCCDTSVLACYSRVRVRAGAGNFSCESDSEVHFRPCQVLPGRVHHRRMGLAGRLCHALWPGLDRH